MKTIKHQTIKEQKVGISVIITLFPYEDSLGFFKPGAPATGRRTPGFLKFILCGLSVCLLTCVCVSAPKAINN